MSRKGSPTARRRFLTLRPAFDDELARLFRWDPTPDEQAALCDRLRQWAKLRAAPQW